MPFEQELDIYLRSRFTLIVLVTPEEERVLSAVKAVCDRTQRPCLTWDVADGFQSLTTWCGSLPSARDPLALEQMSNPQFKRKLYSVVQRLKFNIKVHSAHSSLWQESH